MAQSVIGALRVTMGLDTAQFDQGIKQAQGRMGKLRSSFGGLAAGAAAGAAAALGVAAVKIREVSKAADEMIKAGRGIGLTVEELSRLKLGADRSGLSFQQLMTSLRTFNRSVADLASGETNSAADALRRLGIEARTADGEMKSTRQLLGEVADAFQDLPPGIERSNAVMEIFGSRNADMINLLAGGAEGLRAFDREADSLGKTISTDLAVASERFNDNMERIGDGLNGLWIRVANFLLPALADLTDAFLDLNEVSMTSLNQELARTSNELAKAKESLLEIDLRRERMRLAGTEDSMTAMALAVGRKAMAAVVEDLEEKERKLNDEIERRVGLEEELEKRRKERDNRKPTFRLPPIITLPGASSGTGSFNPGSSSLFGTQHSPLGGAIAQASDGMTALERQAEQVAFTIGNDFADAFGRAISEAENFGQALQGIALTTLNTIGNALIKTALMGGPGIGGGGIFGALSSAVGGLFGGGGLGGGFSIGSGGASMSANPAGLGSTLTGTSGGFSFLSGIGGFRTGGAFQVGGYGGPDSELVAFKASPGENVSIDRNDGGGGGARTVNVNVSGANGDAEIERRVREGVAAGLAEYDRNLPGRMADVNRRYF